MLTEKLKYEAGIYESVSVTPAVVKPLRSHATGCISLQSTCLEKITVTSLCNWCALKKVHSMK